MLDITYEQSFLKILEKIKDAALKERVQKQIIKIIDNPEIGKPMRNLRKGTREVYISPHRLSYSYSKQDNQLIFLDFYHKDEQ